jgi:CHASE2 domain-containing sensor protein
MFIHYFDALHALDASNGDVSWDHAFAIAYRQYPHTFIFGLLTAMLTVQLVGLGVLALQNKQYFDELFDLGSDATRRRIRLAKR